MKVCHQMTGRGRGPGPTGDGGRGPLARRTGVSSPQQKPGVSLGADGSRGTLWSGCFHISLEPGCAVGEAGRG
jgi:hypothetical protein